MRKGFILVIMILVGLFMALPVMAQSIGPDWDYLRPGTNPTAAKLVDSLMCYGTKTDTSKPFYFNNLAAKGSIYLKLVTKDPSITTMRLPRIEYAFLSENTTGKKYFKPIDSLVTVLQAGPDSNRAYVGSVQKWDTTEVKSRWALLVDSASIGVVTAGDTLLRVLKYDWVEWKPYAVAFRLSCPLAAESTLVKQFYMTGSKPVANVKLSY
jgi:hypothetical protein